MTPQDVAIDQITFAAYNPRTITQRQFSDLQSSIDNFGFVENVVLNKRSHEGFGQQQGQLTMISGHMRTRAAKELGHTTVPAIILDLDLDSEKALNVGMNKLGGEFDNDRLAEVLAEIEANNEALLAYTGFTHETMAKLQDGWVKEPEPDTDSQERCESCGQVIKRTSKLSTQP